MSHIRHIRPIAAALAGLACAWLGLAVAAPAAFAFRDPPTGEGGLAQAPVHAVAAGGMPGWQIALIAIGAALLAATAAVLAYRAWTVRRKPTPAAA
jgi:hypothetical protein